MIRILFFCAKFSSLYGIYNRTPSPRISRWCAPTMVPFPTLHHGFAPERIVRTGKGSPPHFQKQSIFSIRKAAWSLDPLLCHSEMQNQVVKREEVEVRRQMAALVTIYSWSSFFGSPQSMPALVPELFKQHWHSDTPMAVLMTARKLSPWT